MTTTEQLKEIYLQFYCELGFDHPDTIAARQRYYDSLNSDQ